MLARGETLEIIRECLEGSNRFWITIPRHGNVVHRRTTVDAWLRSGSPVQSMNRDRSRARFFFDLSLVPFSQIL
jgi:hypothetical protein